MAIHYLKPGPSGMEIAWQGVCGKLVGRNGSTSETMEAWKMEHVLSPLSTIDKCIMAISGGAGYFLHNLLGPRTRLLS